MKMIKCQQLNKIVALARHEGKYSVFSNKNSNPAIVSQKLKTK